MTFKKVNSRFLGTISERELFWLTQNAGLGYTSKGSISVLDEHIELVVERNFYTKESGYGKNQKLKEERVQEYYSQCSQNLLPLDYFSWIEEKDERLCRFLCQEITKSKYAPQSIEIPPNEQMHMRGNVTHKIPKREITHYFSEIKATSEEFFKHFVYYLDWVFDINLEEKKSTLSVLHYAWGNVFEGINHDWIDINNAAQINWLWDHLSRLNNPLPPSTSMKERYYLSILIFDSMYSDAPDSALLLQMKAKKAWSQKKHRDNRNGKKAFNFVMHERTKLMLDELATHEDRKVGEMLERIIKQAHNKTFV